MWKLSMLWARCRRELMLAWLLLRHKRAPWTAKLLVVLALLYVLDPIDLIPDTIPILGWLDDGLVLMLLLRIAFFLLPRELYQSLVAQVDQRPVDATR